MSKKTEKKQARNQNEEREERLACPEEMTGKNMTLELADALEEEKKRSENYLNRLKYMQADFENLKKRLERQLEEIRKYGNERLILELLEIVDELDLAVEESRQTRSVEVLLKGVEMTLKKLKKILEGEGVSPIDCIDQVFDPAKHDVIEKIESEEEGKIIEEIRKGYTMKGKVIRPSVVKITVRSSSKTSKEVESSE